MSQKDFEESLAGEGAATGKRDDTTHQAVAVNSDRIAEIVGQSGLMVESEELVRALRGQAGMRQRRYSTPLLPQRPP